MLTRTAITPCREEVVTHLSRLKTRIHFISSSKEMLLSLREKQAAGVGPLNGRTSKGHHMDGKSKLSPISVLLLVTARTKRDQILQFIVAELAPGSYVVNL
jgi:hypothetical protein